MIKVHKAASGKLQHEVEVGDNRFITDVSVQQGGEGAGPDPHDLLDSALGACTALTVKMVALRKQMPLEDIRVEITHEETDTEYHLHRRIELIGDLTAEQREYLMGIANKCPIHKALHKKFDIESELAS